MKSNTPLLKTLLLASAASLSFYATPAWADDVTLTEEATTIYASSLSGTTATFGAANYVIGSGSNSGWIFVNQSAQTAPMQNYTTITFESGTTFSGEGLFGIYFQQGFSGNTETVDLTNVTASGLSGQLSVENAYNNVTIVKVKGDTWSNVEYLFGDAEGSHHGTSGDTLTLTDSTTFAGISGTTAGTGESITVTTAGTTLTIAGTGTYSFYGTVGASGAEVSLAMSSTGSGKQTFGGTNYLQDVTVTAGTLALEGTTSITGDVSVTSGTLELGGTTSITGAVSVNGGTLDISGSTTFGSTVTVESGTLNLSGEVTLSNTITNSGTVVVDSNVVFVLSDSLKGEDNTYTIISNSGGSITGWGSLDYTNFGLDSARQLTSSENGSITIDTTQSAHSLTWNGTGSGDTWNSNASGNTVWTNDGSNDYFVNGDNVTFGSTGAGTITLGGAITAGNITFTDGSYTISNGSGTSLTAGTILVEGTDGTTVTIATSTVTAENINFANHSSTGGSADNTNDDYKQLVIGDGENVTTATVGAMSILGQSEIVVAANSTLTVSGTITSGGGFHTSISGGGTLIANSLTQNAENNVLDISIANLQVGTFTKAAGTLTFSGGSATIDTMTVSSAKSNITFTGGGTYTIGSYSTTTTAGSTLTLGEDTQVTMGTLSAAWHETVTLDTGATLTVTEELSVHTATTDTFSGGTINAEKLNIYNNATIAKFSDTNLNIGSGGIVNTGTGYVDFGDNLTVGVYAGTSGENTSWSTSGPIQFTGTGTGTTFYTKEGESIALSGVLSGTGSFTKDGAGTLELSGTNTFTGGVTVSAGTVVAKSETALGSGNVTVASGATLQLDTAVSVSGETSTVAFAAGAKLIISGELLESLAIDDYAAEGTSVTIIVANNISFGGTSLNDSVSGDELDSLINAYVSAGNYQLTWTWSDGTLYASAVGFLPEPELFSVFLGISALGLVATRRRKRRVA